MARYAESTTVSAEASRAEIERLLIRYGASGFLYGWEGRRAQVMFRMQDKMVKFVLEMPDPKSEDFTRTPARGYLRSSDEAYRAWEQGCRQKWRALALVIKAKLEAVESAITEFESEFLAHIVLPNGETVGHFMLPQVQAAYETGKMPALLPGIGETGG